MKADRTMKYFVHLVCGLAIISFILGGCVRAAPPGPDYSFSFERSMEGWQANGLDLDNPPVEWSIEASRDIARDGKSSVRLYLNNINDAGKIWIERSFDVEPNRVYQVRVEYFLASADWGDVNLWTIITGVVPESAGKELSYQDTTGNNSRQEEGFVWLHKGYDFTVDSGAEGRLIAIIGIWGTWETARTYYLDSINVTFSPLIADQLSILPSND